MLAHLIEFVVAAAILHQIRQFLADLIASFLLPESCRLRASGDGRDEPSVVIMSGFTVRVSGIGAVIQQIWLNFSFNLAAASRLDIQMILLSPRS
jgi:hypothetical protein